MEHNIDPLICITMAGGWKREGVMVTCHVIDHKKFIFGAKVYHLREELQCYVSE